MARYRKVEVRTWGDEKFRALTPIKPCGQGLWIWFLTGPRTTNIPGIITGTDMVMAAELRWPLEAFREAFGEAFREGMAKASWDAGLVWLPQATKVGEKRNKPESPNVIRSWRDTWDEIPECALKLEVWQHLKAFAEAFGEAFAEAFREACSKPSVKPLPNQEQEQNQEQKQNQNESESARAPAREGISQRTNPDTPKVPGHNGSAGVRHFGTALCDIGGTSDPESDNRWREEPGINAKAMDAWLEHCSQLEPPKVVKPGERLVLAKMLARQGDADAQMRLVENCSGNGWRNLRLTDARQATSTTASGGKRKTIAELEVEDVWRRHREGEAEAHIAREAMTTIERVREILAQEEPRHAVG